MKRILVRLLAAGAFLASIGSSRGSDSVMSGWDLFLIQPGTEFMGQPFVGERIGTFNFGSGAQDVGGTGAIIQRLDDVFTPSSPTGIRLRALRMSSQNQFDFNGNGLDYYFLTLQSARGLGEGPRPNSIGTFAVDFGPEGNPHGTFSASLDIYFDIRKGSLTGPIVFSDHYLLLSLTNEWGHVPSEPLSPATVPAIDGVNRLLNGVDTDNDFWLSGSLPGGGLNPHPVLSLVDPNGFFVLNLAVPEPSTTVLSLFAAGLVGVSLLRRKVDR